MNKSSKLVSLFLVVMIIMSMGVFTNVVDAKTSSGGTLTSQIINNSENVTSGITEGKSGYTLAVDRAPRLSIKTVQGNDNVILNVSDQNAVKYLKIETLKLVNNQLKKDKTFIEYGELKNKKITNTKDSEAEKFIANWGITKNNIDNRLKKPFKIELRSESELFAIGSFGGNDIVMYLRITLADADSHENIVVDNFKLKITENNGKITVNAAPRMEFTPKTSDSMMFNMNIKDNNKIKSIKIYDQYNKSKEYLNIENISNQTNYESAIDFSQLTSSSKKNKKYRLKFIITDYTGMSRTEFINYMIKEK